MCCEFITRWNSKGKQGVFVLLGKISKDKRWKTINCCAFIDFCHLLDADYAFWCGCCCLFKQRLFTPSQMQGECCLGDMKDQFKIASIYNGSRNYTLTSPLSTVRSPLTNEARVPDRPIVTMLSDVDLLLVLHRRHCKRAIIVCFL